MNLFEIRNDIVHSVGALNSEYTLCGLSIDEIISINDSYKDEHDIINTYRKTKNKINCIQCLKIIEYCQHISN